MNIYELQIKDEKEWIYASTVFEALQFYNSVTDWGLHDFETGDDIVLLPQEKWKEMTISNPDDLDEDGKPKIKTFEEYVKDSFHPEIIAGTMY